MNIVNVGYASTNYYVLAARKPLLLVDVGWPGTLPMLRHQCKRSGIELRDVPYLLITHYHPDHAGLAQELKRLGLQLIVLPSQVPTIPRLRTYMKPEHNYLELDPSDNIRLDTEDSRAFLAQIGIQGEIIGTPGHSDDSITLVLDEGMAFTGDLTPLAGATEDTLDMVRQSWEAIRSRGVRTIHPGHGPPWPLR